MRVSRAIWIALLLSSIVTFNYWLENPKESVRLYVFVLEVTIGLIAFSIEISRKYNTESKPKFTFDQQLRRVLTANVRRMWIDGVLKDALHDARFDIAMKSAQEQIGKSAGYEVYSIPQADAPQQPTHALMQRIKIELRRKHKSNEIIPNRPETIAQAFNNFSGKLLILGEPGSGKSVLLLQLAEKLLDKANQLNSWPLPIVLNLSVWTVERKPIDEWIIEELQHPAYGLRKKQAAELIGNKRLIFLLDGLDEVAAAHRLECLEKVNTFMAAGQRVALCSRTKEYEALETKLEVHHAIEIRPLTSDEAESYLKQYIPLETVTTILHMLKRDEEVWQEACKPFFLNILIATYHDRDVVSVTAQRRPDQTTHQQIGQLIIEPYIECQLQAASIVPSHRTYSNAKIRRYLAWLGWYMRQHEQSVFYVEKLQRRWLPRYKRLYILLCLLVVGLIAGLVSGLVFGLIAGLFVELIAGFAFELRGGLVVGLIFGLGVGLGVGLKPINLDMRITWKQVLVEMIGNSATGLVIDNIFGSIFAFFWEKFFDLRDESLPVYRLQLNQGLRDTLIYGLVFGLVYGTAFGLLFGILFGWLVVGLGGDLDIALVIGLSGGLVVGLGSGLIVGLGSGLGDVFKHVILRIFLWGDSIAPRRFDHFFAYVKNRRLMRQVGGGMIFIHRYVLEYFADQYAEESVPAGQERGRPGSTETL